ncbi:hypothetical protein [uncultured Cohaesibacter sp.]|uniref:hypothetical protein n=1 Tax=uncultured Cohaesibacter sp. TaxID=1002546 RepID=UPI002AABCE5E|nr:hypothetical protein [uncultured Cohaesibacter sp.]
MKNAYAKSAVFAALVAGVSLAAPLAAQANQSAADQIVRQADDSIFIVDYVLASQKDGKSAPVSTEKAVVKNLGVASDDESTNVVDYVLASQKAGKNQPVSTQKAVVKNLGVASDDESTNIVDYVLGNENS